MNSIKGIKSTNVLNASFFLAEEDDLHVTNNNCLNNNNEHQTSTSPVNATDTPPIAVNSETNNSQAPVSAVANDLSPKSAMSNVKSVLASNHHAIPQIQLSSSSAQHQRNKAVSNYCNGTGSHHGQASSTRDIDVLKKLLNDPTFELSSLTDTELITLVAHKEIPLHRLESLIHDAERSVRIRRDIVTDQLAELNIEGAIDTLPFEDFNYDIVVGACCENVIGYVQVPVGKAGPLLLDGKTYYVPMATTEGCLVASTSRGFSALLKSGGVISNITKDEMTRAPVIKIADINERIRAIDWLNQEESRKRLTKAFNSTSSFGRLVGYDTATFGQLIFIRFRATTGDAMGMNMLSKGSEQALEEMKKEFPSIEVVSLSGNYCTDKKPAAVNWILGRGKTVSCEAVLSPQVVQSVLKISTDSLYDIWVNKVMIGSAVAGSIGGFNCQAANIVTAIYIATGQDPAQNITSSNCLITMEKIEGGKLRVSCTMPSVECGTVGGGTILAAQGACLKMMGVQGPSRVNPGDNAKTLARIVCASVMAGELSLLAALSDGTLVKSHMRHNRSRLNVLSNGTGDR